MIELCACMLDEYHIGRNTVEEKIFSSEVLQCVKQEKKLIKKIIINCDLVLKI